MQNIDSDLIRGNIDTIILKTMLEEDKYGLDIIKEVEQRSNGTYELKQPTLYSCLKRLENQELISSYWLNSDIGGRRHYYKLTEKGREFYNKKQEEWAKSKFVIDNLLSNYNYEEYRLVKKDDYDKVINGAIEIDEEVSPSENSNQSTNTSTQFFEDNSDDEVVSDSPIEENIEDEDSIESGISIEENELADEENELADEENENFDAYQDDYSDENEESYQNGENVFDFQENRYTDSFEDKANNEDTVLNEELEEDNNEAELEEENSVIYVSDESSSTDEEDDENETNISYELPDQTENENNILNMLRNQKKEEINTYEGDKKSYANQIRSIYDDVKYVQDDMVFAEQDEDEYDVDQKIKDFADVAKELNNFDSSIEFDNQINNEPSDENDQEIDNFNLESDEDTIDIESDDESITVDNTEDDLSDDFENLEEELSDSSDNSDSESENNTEFDFSISDDEIESEINTYKNFDYSQEDDSKNISFFSSSDGNNYSFEPDINQTQNENFAESDEDYQISETTNNLPNYSDDFSPTQYDSYHTKFNKDEYDSTFVNIKKDFDSETNVYEESNLENSDIDSIVSKNLSSDPAVSVDTNNFFERRYINENYKQKLSNLTVYSKVSSQSISEDNNQPEPIEADDLETLKLNFEREGIKVKEFKKITKYEEPEKTYLLINKINLIKSLILLFGYVFALSGMYIVLQNSAFSITSEDFNIKYFIFGFIPFIIIVLYNLVQYLVSPYKKVPARYASRIMIFISVILTVQLLLITYCVNLQLGFYSFTQAGYNHLLWIIPSVLSFGPIVSNLIYMALFYSENFNV